MQTTTISIVQKPNLPSLQESWVEGSYPAMAPLLSLAVDETQSQGAYVYSFDPLAATARLVGWTGPPASDSPLSAEVPRSAAKVHLERNAPLVLHEKAWSDARFEPLPEFARNRFEGVASIPLLESGTVVGLMNVCRSRRASLQGRALSFLLSLSAPVSALLAGEAARVLRIIDGLAAEGEEPTLVLWCIAEELRSILQWSAQPRGAARRLLRGGRRRQELLRSAHARVPRERAWELLGAAARIDALIKGPRKDEAWSALARVATELCIAAGIRAS